MPVINNNNLGNKVTTSDRSWLDLCIRAWGSEWNAPDHGAYNFNGRLFDSTDRGTTGIYGVQVVSGLQIENGKPNRYPDMYQGVILQESGGRVGIDG